MKFQIGDKVLIQHSNEEGEIIEILSNQMVMVDVRGVKFPAYIDQLDFPYFKQFTEKKIIPHKKHKTYVDQVPVEKKTGLAAESTGVWLAFLPVFEVNEFGDEVAETLKVYLVNQTPVGLGFFYELKYAGKSSFDLRNQVSAFQDFYLHDIPFENLNDSPTFDFDFTLLVPDKKKADHYGSTVKLKAKQVFARIEEIKSKGEATFSYLLFEHYPQAPEKQEAPNLSLSGRAGKAYEASQARKHLEPPKYEVDLHIEKLSDTWRSMTNFEIITLQLQAFEKYYDLALAHRQPSMVVIHGVGSGKLRDEIHELLRMKKEVKSFINQYDARYGYGATEIFFQYA
jgi:Smr domain